MGNHWKFEHLKIMDCWNTFCVQILIKCCQNIYFCGLPCIKWIAPGHCLLLLIIEEQYDANWAIPDFKKGHPPPLEIGHTGVVGRVVLCSSLTPCKSMQDGLGFQGDSRSFHTARTQKHSVWGALTSCACVLTSLPGGRETTK